MVAVLCGVAVLCRVEMVCVCGGEGRDAEMESGSLISTEIKGSKNGRSQMVPLNCDKGGCDKPQG